MEIPLAENRLAFPGFYSGIFAMYLIQHQESNDKMKTILFYALCVLYALSIATISMDVVIFVIQVDVVSNIFIKKRALIRLCSISCTTSIFSNQHYSVAVISSLNLFWYAQLTIPIILYYLKVQIFKDLPLLDCMGLRYPSGDPSFTFNNRILRSVNLSCELYY